MESIILALKDLEAKHKEEIIKVKFYALREQLYNLKASGVNISEKVYLSRIHELIDQEAEALDDLKTND